MKQVKDVEEGKDNKMILDETKRVVGRGIRTHAHMTIGGEFSVLVIQTISRKVRKEVACFKPRKTKETLKSPHEC